MAAGWIPCKVKKKKKIVLALTGPKVMTLGSSPLFPNYALIVVFHEELAPNASQDKSKIFHEFKRAYKIAYDSQLKYSKCNTFRNNEVQSFLFFSFLKHSFVKKIMRFPFFLIT